MILRIYNHKILIKKNHVPFYMEFIDIFIGQNGYKGLGLDVYTKDLYKISKSLNLNVLVNFDLKNIKKFLIENVVYIEFVASSIPKVSYFNTCNFESLSRMIHYLIHNPEITEKELMDGISLASENHPKKDELMHGICSTKEMRQERKAAEARKEEILLEPISNNLLKKHEKFFFKIIKTLKLNNCMETDTPKVFVTILFEISKLWGINFGNTVSEIQYKLKKNFNTILLLGEEKKIEKGYRCMIIKSHTPGQDRLFFLAEFIKYLISHPEINDLKILKNAVNEFIVVDYSQPSENLLEQEFINKGKEIPLLEPQATNNSKLLKNKNIISLQEFKLSDIKKELDDLNKKK